MVVFSKLLIIVAVVGLLRSSHTFRAMSREADEAALISLKRILQATEECGYPREIILLLVAFTIVAFMAVFAAAGS